MNSLTHDHDHAAPEAPPLETAPMPAASQYRGENEHIINFMKSNKIDLEPFNDDARPASNAFQKVVRHVNLSLIKAYEKQSTGPAVPPPALLNQTLNECIHYTRRKMKQGRQWSRRFVEAIHDDYLIAFKRDMETRNARPPIMETPTQNTNNDSPTTPQETTTTATTNA
jgi:hypothetical protein